MITAAQETEDGWVLNGAKMWITNGSTAHVAVVWAKTGDRWTIQGPSAASSCRPTRRGSPPKTRRASFRCARLTRASSCSRTCACPGTRCCPKSGGLKGPLFCLTAARYGIAWGAVGAAMACYDEAVAVRQDARDVRQAHRRFSAAAGAARRDAHRDHQGAASLLQLGRLKDQGTMSPAAGVAGQAQQRGHGHRGRPRSAAAARRQRHPRRVPGDAAHGQPGVGLHV